MTGTTVSKNIVLPELTPHFVGTDATSRVKVATVPTLQTETMVLTPGYLPLTTRPLVPAP